MNSLFSSIKSKFSPQRIQVFVRHCHYSSASAHKTRLKAFSKEKCFRNLIDTADLKRVNFTFLLDTFHSAKKKHFLLEQRQFPVIEIQAGYEANSFLKMLEYVSAQPFTPDTLIYFLEDDYLHRPGWVNVLEEAFTLPQVDYATLFDHRDKYFASAYLHLESRIFHTQSCHWRTTPSTTNTYAMRFKTLKEHLPIHQAFSQNCRITADHDKFCRLREMGAVLVSSIPGYSTHAEPEYASPCVDWE